MRVAQTNPYSCLAAVAAMIAEVSIEEVFKSIGHDGSHQDQGSGTSDGLRPIRITEIATFLAGHGFLLGAVADALDGSELVKMVEGFDICINISCCCPAILVVEGVNSTHAVLWTGSFVLDPRPDRQGTYDLDDYRILQWWPVVMVA